MQQIMFQNIHLENCGCHHVMDIDFIPNTLTGIVGKNGKGKSTIYNSLMIGLFGDTGEAKGNSLRISDLVNRKVMKDLFINIFFTVDEDEYEIRKYQKHTQHSNKMILIKNNENISEKSVTETHKKIETILVTKGVFRNTVYFGQQIKDFFTALTNSEQKLIFNAIFAFEEWLERYKFTDTQLKLAVEKLESFKFDRVKITNQIPEKKMYLALLLKTKKEKEDGLKERKCDLLKETVELKEGIINLDKEKETIEYDNEAHDKIKSESAKFEVEQSNIKDDAEKETEVAETLCTTNVDMLKVQAKQEYTEQVVTIGNKYSDEIDKLTSEKNQKEVDNSNIKTEASSATLVLVESSNKITSKLESEINTADNSLTEKVANISRIVTTGADLSEKIHELDKEEFNTKEKSSIDCTKCGQTLGVNERKKVIEGIKSEKKISYTELSKLKEEDETLQSEVVKLRSEIEKLQKKNDKEKESCRKKVEAVEQERDEKIDSINEEQSIITDQLEKITGEKDSEILEIKGKIQKDYKQKINEQMVNKENTLKEIQKSLEKRDNVLYNTLNDLCSMNK